MINSREESAKALKIVTAAIANCEKMQPKFAEGTSQHSLLRNRIKALKIAESLLRNDGRICAYSCTDLERALPPIISIHSKMTNARKKYEEGTAQYQRFTPTIDAMVLCRALVEQELHNRKDNTI